MGPDPPFQMTEARAASPGAGARRNPPSPALCLTRCDTPFRRPARRSRPCATIATNRTFAGSIRRLVNSCQRHHAVPLCAADSSPEPRPPAPRRGFFSRHRGHRPSERRAAPSRTQPDAHPAAPETPKHLIPPRAGIPLWLALAKEPRPRAAKDKHQASTDHPPPQLTRILPCKVRWQHEVLTEGCPPLATATPSVPRSARDTSPARADRLKTPHLRHSREGRNPTLHLVFVTNSKDVRPCLANHRRHPAKAGISLLVTKHRQEKRDPSFRWDDGRNTTVRFPPPDRSPQGRSAPGFPVSSPSALGRESRPRRDDLQRPENPHPPLAGEVAGRRPDGGVSRHREGDTPPSRAQRATPPLPGEDG